MRSEVQALGQGTKGLLPKLRSAAPNKYPSRAPMGSAGMAMSQVCLIFQKVPTQDQQTGVGRKEKKSKGQQDSGKWGPRRLLFVNPLV